MNENDVTKSSGNVFLDLGFEPGEATVMLLRVEVASHIIKQIKKKGWTPTESACQLGIPLSQVARIFEGKVEDVSLDTLWMIAVRSGLELQLQLKE